jgi:hypothetical protein
MKTFQIYATKGKLFELKFERFAFDGERFILFDYADRPSHHGYLNVDNIAAIHCPRRTPDEYGYRYYGIKEFHVYLLTHTEPLVVHAHNFQVSDSEIEFFTKHPAHGQHRSSTVTMKNDEIYVRRSEAVAVMPSDGFK